jgi:SAM-dependent methyltransferase
MTSATNPAPCDYPTVDYDQHARTCPPDDFWGQVKRTLYGKAVSDAHIEMIIQAIKRNLALRSHDIVLDLACGNGALSQRLFDSCAGLVGIDISEYLIEVANRHFAVPPQFAFVTQGAAEYLRAEPRPERFTKILCYGSFAYFSQHDAHAVLQLLAERFSNVESFFIGNLPDLDRAAEFYKQRQPDPRELIDPHSQIGIWRSQAGFASMAADAGWDLEFSAMPPEFYSVHYRYDALLRRQSA